MGEIVDAGGPDFLWTRGSGSVTTNAMRRAIAKVAGDAVATRWLPNPVYEPPGGLSSRIEKMEEMSDRIKVLEQKLAGHQTSPNTP